MYQFWRINKQHRTEVKPNYFNLPTSAKARKLFIASYRTKKDSCASNLLNNVDTLDKQSSWQKREKFLLAYK